MNIGIYGGSFNPLHNGHIALAEAFLDQAGLDEVWFVVSPQNPFKVNDRLLDDKARLEMTATAIGNKPGMKASDVEFHLPKPSYMWNTLQHLSSVHPDDSFTLLIGGDNWTSFGRWYHAADILSHYRVAVYPRQGDNFNAADMPPNVQLLHTRLLNISSTALRKMIKKGENIDEFVPFEVSKLIRERGYYR